MSNLIERIDSNFATVDTHLEEISNVWVELNKDVLNVANKETSDKYFKRLETLYNQIESLLYLGC